MLCKHEVTCKFLSIAISECLFCVIGMPYQNSVYYAVNGQGDILLLLRLACLGIKPVTALDTNSSNLWQLMFANFQPHMLDLYLSQKTLLFFVLCKGNLFCHVTIDPQLPYIRTSSYNLHDEHVISHMFYRQLLFPKSLHPWPFRVQAPIPLCNKYVMLAAFTLQLHVYFQADHYRNAKNGFEFFGLPIVHKKMVALPVQPL